MTDHPGGAEARRAACSILQYLVRHPQAKDTPEGIATWWLRQHEIEHAVHQIYAGLDLLVGERLVVECHGPDRTRYYVVNADRPDAIAHFLGEPET